ncbi:uncharacterized protein Hap1MRO34_020655 [Clarias gariepinus]
MGIRVELEMLAVLLFLTPVVIDGVVLTKCQLVKDLQSAVPPTMPDRDAVIAKIVRQAETVANFNTNFTIQITPPTDTAKSRSVRSASKSSAKAAAKAAAKTAAKAAAKPTTKAPIKVTTKPALASPPNTTQSSKPKNMTQMAPMNNHTTPPGLHGVNSSHSDEHMSPPSNGSQKWTLYSVFLIPDAVACTAPNVSSFNVCNTNCNALLNDDITLATNCMLTILTKPSNTNPGPEQEGANDIMEDLFNKFMQSFPDLSPSDYLAECPNQ